MENKLGLLVCEAQGQKFSFRPLKATRGVFCAWPGTLLAAGRDEMRMQLLNANGLPDVDQNIPGIVDFASYQGSPNLAALKLVELQFPEFPS